MTTGTASDVELINPDALARPSGFTHAVRHGDTVHLSGQTAMDATGTIVDGDIVHQFRQALTNVITALRAAGSEPADLLSVRIYLLDVPGYQARGREIGAIWKELCGRTYPAMTGVGVTALWQPEALIEIEAVAARRV
ncbi:RidA family protein [Pseudonocardia sp. HH130629-09]|uniref:RidA family protein n=1 Tax=Pseudonocardia sp. HH130629-09 TaxID=1641402 RepID=UPI0006CB5231|nr:RidA family protein [Pseudonocardia sp. HH130629-09]ALE84808.1 endoribonuclease L-PSP [Pseudonocardia sp. HH130629-09]